MKLMRLFIVFAFLLVATGYTEEPADTYIKSLQMPCYPPLARQTRVSGIVKVKVVMAGDGTVASAELVQGHPLLRAAAVANVQTWKFGAGANQDPSQLRTTITFEYKLGDESGWERCAARVVFDSFNKVTVEAHVPAPSTYAPRN
jgi:TonB family protein